MASRFLPVYKLVKKIPRGRVITYGGIARALRWRNGARTVGWAMHNCPSGLGLPWHRVVGAGGRILLREPESSLQIRLLESEGIAVRELRVDLKQHEWKPERTLVGLNQVRKQGPGIRTRNHRRPRTTR